MKLSDLPQWKCHKVVRAAKITGISTDGLSYYVYLGSKGEPYFVQGSVFARGVPAIGDYLVVYEDGYVSWSPAKAFEAGYTLIIEEN